MSFPVFMTPRVNWLCRSRKKRLISGSFPAIKNSLTTFAMMREMGLSVSRLINNWSTLTICSMLYFLAIQNSIAQSHWRPAYTIPYGSRRSFQSTARVYISLGGLTNISFEAVPLFIFAPLTSAVASGNPSMTERYMTRSTTLSSADAESRLTEKRSRSRCPWMTFRAFMLSFPPSSSLTLNIVWHPMTFDPRGMLSASTFSYAPFQFYFISLCNAFSSTHVCADERWLSDTCRAPMCSLILRSTACSSLSRLLPTTSPIKCILSECDPMSLVAGYMGRLFPRAGLLRRYLRASGMVRLGRALQRRSRISRRCQ